jgi:hypothetical protein
MHHIKNEYDRQHLKIHSLHNKTKEHRRRWIIHFDKLTVDMMQNRFYSRSLNQEEAVAEEDLGKD